MANNATVKVKVEGESEFKTALKGCTESMKTLKAEAKAISSSFTAETSAVEKATKSITNLKNQQKNYAEQISTLEARIEKVSNAEGDHASELNKLNTQLYKAKEGYNKVTNQLNEYQSEIDQSTQKTSKLKTALASVDTEKLSSGLNKISTVLTKTLVAGCSAAVAGLVKLGKQSVELYSDYQQLSGGITKLFGTDALTVINNANNAFKSAGMSANTYLENVTTFSASLIKSLGNDTAEAATMADQIMQDISDNVNTYGTDLESVTNVYKSLAKEQYTTLDNLNLGFAGTKEGAEELIAEAEKLDSTFEAATDENGDYTLSFSDMAEAIHIVQENMGIAGTTSKEASTTIQGSISSLSAAWENLLSGLSDPDADIGNLVKNVTEAAGTALKNLIPVVKNFINNVPVALKTAFPQASESIDSFTKGLSSLFSIVSSLTPVFNTLASNVGTVVKVASGLAVYSKIGSYFTSNLDNIKLYGTYVKDTASAIKGLVSSKSAISSLTSQINGLSKVNVSDVANQTGVSVQNITTATNKLNGELTKAKVNLQEAQNTGKEVLKGAVSNVGNLISGAAAIASGIAVIGTAIYTVYEVFKEKHEAALKAISDLSEGEQELADTASETAESIAQQNETTATTIAQSSNQMDYYESLVAELESMADAEGNVSDAEKDRANFIVNTLNTALGTEYTITGNQIDNYTEMISKIKELIATKRTQAALTAKETEYSEAIKNQKTALTEAAKAQAAYAAAINDTDYTEAKNKLEEYKEQLANTDASDVIGTLYWSGRVNSQQEIVDAYEEHNAALHQAYQEDIQNYQEYTNDIATYEAAYQAQLAGDEEAALDIIQNGVTERTKQYQKEADNAQIYTDEELAVYETKKAELAQHYADLLQAKEDAGDDWTSVQEDQLELAEKALTDFIDSTYEEQAMEKGKDTGEALIDGVADGASDSEGKVGTAVDGAISDASVEGQSTANSQGAVVGNCMVNSASSSISGNSGISTSFIGMILSAILGGNSSAAGTSAVGNTMTTSTLSGLSGNSISTTFCSKITDAKSSASNISFSGIGSNMVSGVLSGLAYYGSSIATQFVSLCTSALSAAKSALGISSPSKVARDLIGKNIVKGVEVGITSETKKLNNTMTQSAYSAVSAYSRAFNSVPSSLMKDFGINSSDGLNYNINLRNQTNMQDAMVQALSGVQVVMDGERMGRFVSNTITSEVFG